MEKPLKTNNEELQKKSGDQGATLDTHLTKSNHDAKKQNLKQDTKPLRPFASGAMATLYRPPPPATCVSTNKNNSIDIIQQQTHLKQFQKWSESKNLVMKVCSKQSACIELQLRPELERRFKHQYPNLKWQDFYILPMKTSRDLNVYPVGIDINKDINEKDMNGNQENEENQDVLNKKQSSMKQSKHSQQSQHSKQSQHLGGDVGLYYEFGGEIWSRFWKKFSVSTGIQDESILLQSEQDIQDIHAQVFNCVTHLLRCILYLHTINITHDDIWRENVLIAPFHNTTKKGHDTETKETKETKELEKTKEKTKKTTLHNPKTQFQCRLIDWGDSTVHYEKDQDNVYWWKNAPLRRKLDFLNRYSFTRKDQLCFDWKRTIDMISSTEACMYWFDVCEICRYIKENQYSDASVEEILRQVSFSL